MGTASEKITLTAGTVLGDRYRIVRAVGSGATGAVYEAELLGGERVAVKALSTSASWVDAEYGARFKREIAVCSKLRSPHCVPVLDHGIDAARSIPYLVMPLLAGEDLGALLTRTGALEPDCAVRIFLQACEGLRAAHAAGIIHRDVKPSNIFLDTAPNGKVTVKVCDFGLAKIATPDLDDPLTNSGAFLGTPHYVSPEQATNAKRVDERSDVWGLAMTLYHALAGAPAFGHIDNVVGLIMELTGGTVRPLQDSAPWVEPRLARIVHAALIREPESRCPSIQEFARGLATTIESHLAWESLDVAAIAPVSQGTRAYRANRASIPAAWEADLLPDTVDQAPGEEALVGATFGRYRLGPILGRGGMGAVYEAEADGQEYALKIVRPEVALRSRDAARRFVREARASKAIAGEHVTQVVDAGTDETRGVPYMVMERLRGADLATLMRERGPMDPRALVRVFIEACEGLAAAHQQGVIHRDIKPGNIFLHQASGGITTKLCDFGVAKQLAIEEAEHQESDLTRTGGMLGSPLYMSPEQAQNAKNVDHRSDLWSLAITMHQALSGERPWPGCTTMGELILAICTREMVPLARVAPWVEPGLAEVIHRTLRRVPAERYASAQELARALEPFAAPRLESLDALVPVSESRRAMQVAPLAASVDAPQWSGESTDGQVATAPSRARQPRSRMVLVAIAGGIGAAALALFVVARVALPSAPPEAPKTNVEPPQPARVRVRVPIHPREARAFVDGVPRGLDDGAVVLEGSPGDAFLVRIEGGGSAREDRVAITSDGRAVPAWLELALETPTPDASVSSKVPPRPSTGPLGTGPRSIIPTASATPSESTTKPSSTGPALQRDW